MTREEATAEAQAYAEQAARQTDNGYTDAAPLALVSLAFAMLAPLLPSDTETIQL